MPQILNSDGQPHKLCPVRAFKNYINKLNPKNDWLWQKPIKDFLADPSKPWYCNQKIGNNTHNLFMATVTEKLKLQTRYTNHCIRVTGITNLRRGSFNAKQVMSVSGHKSVDSLAIDERIQADEKLMMGMCLTYSLLRPEDAIMIQNNLEIKEEIHQIPMAPIKQLTTPPPQQAVIQLPKSPEKNLIPFQNAIVPYEPQVKPNAEDDFDLMALIAEVENEELPDEELVLAATQCEKSIESAHVTLTTMTKTAVMKRSTTSYPNTTFTGCTFGSIGTINIHIHKHWARKLEKDWQKYQIIA